MTHLKIFNVVPNMPENLKFLETLSHDVWWCWHEQSKDIFRKIESTILQKDDANVCQYMNNISYDKLQALSENTEFVSELKAVEQVYNEEMSKCRVTFPKKGEERKVVCYFSLEYGLHESVRLYSGGLGILAGDHLKSASDLGAPIVAVGLLYKQGYFRQTLDASGWQVEKYPENEIQDMPLVRTLDQDGNPIVISLQLLDKVVKANVWTLKVGNINLLLLDTEIHENPPEFREITWRLYGGDKQMRLRQELLLGMGGYHAVIKAGFSPAVCHMNEGHAAFLSLARIGHLMDCGFSEEEAIEYVARTNIFTTHTPVPAGNETFDLGLLRPYLEALQPEYKISVDRVLSWGVAVNQPVEHELSMTVLGLRMANSSNGVSRLHGEVARQMWRYLWPKLSPEEIPIDHVTNGIHVPSWVSSECSKLYDEVFGSPQWRYAKLDNLEAKISKISDEQLWQVHEANRAKLIRYVRNQYREQLTRRSACWQEVEKSKNILQQDILTIGFARRFATYKRATLLLRDKERLKRLLLNNSRPVQILFAGKAHPADDSGKNFIRDIVRFAEENELTHRLIFVENYDIALARHLVQGVDVWLNNPLRPQEASGTSGMKAAINGVLNCSILDGWWVEGYEEYPKSGWAIPSLEDACDHDLRDNYESQALFNIIENEIIPCFYDRNQDGLPEEWIAMMKDVIKMSLWQFSSTRMVSDYLNKFYNPLLTLSDELLANNKQMLQKLVEERAYYQSVLPTLKGQFPKISSAPVEGGGSYHAGETLDIDCVVSLGDVKPEAVTVQVYYGRVDNQNSVRSSKIANMELAEDLGNGEFLYKASIQCVDCGRFGMICRISPKNIKEWQTQMPGFTTWAY